MNPAWRYEPDEDPKRKHHWEKSAAGFEKVRGAYVGKCPCHLSMAEAEELLREAIPYSPTSWRERYPKRLYAVKDGVVYRGTPTVPGESYH